MRLLLTGANGFVGTYAAQAFAEAGYAVVRAGHGPGDHDIELDLADDASVAAAIEHARPEYVLHLAAQSFVPAALADPLATYTVNIMGTARLLQALQVVERPVRVLHVSSAEIYGHSATAFDALPETAPPAPANPYAVSKIAAEYVARGAASPLLEVIVARPFNHIGLGQSSRFVVAGFAEQIARVLAGAEPVLRVGNLEARRDFLDVRDVVRAYVALMRDGTPGETYNIASGTPVPIREILRRLLLIADVPIAVREDPSRMRPSDIPQFYGDATKLRAATGWTPAVDLDASLAAILQAAHRE